MTARTTLKLILSSSLKAVVALYCVHVLFPSLADVYSLGPLFLFLVVALVVALLVSWLALVITLLLQRKLSTLPAHLKSLFMKPCGVPSEEKPKVGRKCKNQG